MLLTEQSLDDLLALVVTLGRRSVEGADGVSVSLARNGGFLTSHASDEVVKELDEVQYRADGGPCVEAMASGRLVSFPLSEGQDQYRAFTEAARRRFMTAVLSSPLSARGSTVGAMNVYSASVTEFDEQAAETAELFARQAAILLSNALAYAASNTVNQQLGTALQTRDLIGQAKGILVATTDCSSDEAFDRLRVLSQARNRKLRDVAAEIVTTAQRGPGSGP